MPITCRNRAIEPGYGDAGSGAHAHAATIRGNERIVRDRATPVAVAEHAIARKLGRTFARQRVDHGALQARVIRLAVELQHDRHFERLVAWHGAHLVLGGMCWPSMPLSKAWMRKGP